MSPFYTGAPPISRGLGRLLLAQDFAHEIVELPAREAADATSARLLDIRGRLVPYLFLREILATPREPGPHQKVIVVGTGGSRLGLVVDRIVGSNQTVIKQLSPLHAGLRTLSGAAILGDGTVALILDVPGFANRERSASGPVPHRP